jgi:hypothetical protein
MDVTGVLDLAAAALRLAAWLAPVLFKNNKRAFEWLFE